MKVGQAMSIEGVEAHHILNVLRLGAGGWIVLSDTDGNRYECKILHTEKKKLEVIAEKKLVCPRMTDITLAQAVIKHDGLESIIKKAVELGASKIIPFTSSRTIPQFSRLTSAKKIERWNKVALAAAKQCGTGTRPIVKAASTIEEVLRSAGDCTHRLLFYEGENDLTPNTYFESAANDRGKTIIVIGPEGGFSAEEIELAKKLDFTTLRLGPLILRVETAAIAAITLTQHFLGHFK